MTHDEREWQAQERALHNERNATDAAADDALVARYRTIARALRRSPPEGLPSNFAHEVARLAAMQTQPAEVDSAVEQWLMRALVGAMVLAGAVVAALYGSQWLQATGSLLAETGSVGIGGWIATLVACFAITFGVDWLRNGRRGEHALRA